MEKNVSLNIVTKYNIVWKLARGYCLRYCKTFSLVPDSTGCTEMFFTKSAVHYLYHLKSNHIIGQRKTNNTEKHFYPGLTSFNFLVHSYSGIQEYKNLEYKNIKMGRKTYEHLFFSFMRLCSKSPSCNRIPQLFL